MGGFEGLLLMEEHKVMAVKIHEKTSPSPSRILAAGVVSKRGSAIWKQTRDFHVTKLRRTTTTTDKTCFLDKNNSSDPVKKNETMEDTGGVVTVLYVLLFAI